MGRTNSGQQEGNPDQTIAQPHCQPTYAEAASGKSHIDPSVIGEVSTAKADVQSPRIGINQCIGPYQKTFKRNINID
jgi:hypothetical protein